MYNKLKIYHCAIDVYEIAKNDIVNQNYLRIIKGVTECSTTLKVGRVNINIFILYI